MSKVTEVEKLVGQIESTRSRGRESAADQLADWLEACQLSDSDFIRVVEALLVAADREPDDVARESIFNALSSASMSNPGAPIDWSSVASSLESLAPDCLEHALLALGFSGNADFKSRIEQYLKHPDEVIRETASEAISTLDHLRESKPGQRVKVTRQD